MTVIAACKLPNRIEIAADSYSASGSNLLTAHNCKTQKIQESRGITFGSCGPSIRGRMLRVFLDEMEGEQRAQIEPTIASMMKLLADFHHWAEELHPNFPANHNFILVFEGELFRTYGGADVIQVSEFVAIGGGETVANTLMHVGFSAYDAALKACELRADCKLPIQQLLIPVEMQSPKLAVTSCGQD